MNFTWKVRLAVGELLVKWLKVSRGIIVDKGTENCPLCKLFYNEGDCKGCPIKKITGKDLCYGTPYDAWINHHNNNHRNLDSDTDGRGIECPECKELARDQFYFILDMIEMWDEGNKPQAMLADGGK